jgi:hypothetical protein
MLRGASWPTGFYAELLGVLGIQLLPAPEVHCVGAHDASNRLTREEPLKDVEADMPSRGAPRDEAAIDVVPEREARAAAERLELTAPFSRTRSPLAALFLRCAPDDVSLDEAEQHNREASLATL